MKRIIIISLCLLLLAPIAYGAISWTKSWSSANDGETFGGSDIQNIQSDVSSQTAQLSADNAFTGTNTFSGTTTFSGTINGVSSAKDCITRGFELVYGSVEQVIVNVGTLYHGTTQVNKTANVHLGVTTAGDYITGVSQQAASTWLYVYVNSSGGIDFDTTAPDKSDVSGDTEGTLIYYYYSTGTTYHRCIGAIYLNATGSGEITKFYSNDGKTYFWNAPISITTSASDEAWSVATSCATAMPAISRMGIFRGSATVSNSYVAVAVKPNGATGGTVTAGANSGWFTLAYASADTAATAGDCISLTDSSQQIQYATDGSTVALFCRGYVLNIR